jgi:ribosomal protein S18
MKLNNKNKLLILTSIILILIAYKVAISKTFFYYNSYNSTKEKLVNSENEKKTLGFLYAKNKKLDAILKNNHSEKNSLNHQNYLLKVISNLCENHKVKIINFEEPEILTAEKGKITHYKFSIEGNFNTILLFLNQLENKPFIGKIEHFSTEKKMDYKKNSVEIISTIVLEKLTDNKD